MLDSLPLLERNPLAFNNTVASREYLAAGFLLNPTTLSVLAYDSDIITQMYGDGTIERMLRDPELKKCITIIKTNILVDGIEFFPALSKPPVEREIPEDETPLQKGKRVKLAKDTKRYELSKVYSDFLNRSLKKLDKPILTTLESMLDALFYGNKIAEKVFTKSYDTVLKEEKFIITSLRVKKREHVAFVQNKYGKTVGIQGWSYINGERKLTVLPVAKFLILAFGERNEDPRGISCFEPAYNAWYLKTLIFPEWLRWLQQCALPGIIAVMPEVNERKALIDRDTGLPVTDKDGEIVYKDESVYMLESLMMMKNSSVMVAPHGSSFEVINNSVSGDPFKGMLDALNKEMEMSILLQTLATSDSKHNTRAASETHMSVLDGLIYRLKQVVIDALTDQYSRQMLRINFPDFDEELLPKVNLGSSVPRDWQSDIQAISSLYSSGYMSESQLVGTDQILQLPDREGLSKGSLRDSISAAFAKAQDNLPEIDPDTIADRPTTPAKPATAPAKPAVVPKPLPTATK